MFDELNKILFDGTLTLSKIPKNSVVKRESNLFVANFLCDEIAFQIGILFPKLFSPTVRKNCSKGREILFCKFLAFRLEFQKFFSISRTIGFKNY